MKSMHSHRFHIAVWIVIASEALLFAALFALYSAYRAEYTQAFETGVAHDLQWAGGANTLILLASSFAIAWAIHLVRSGRTTTASWFLLVVLVLGLTFLVLKIYEWGDHISEGLLPGSYFAGDPYKKGIGLFFTLYYGMTGLHALHVIAGLVLVTWVLMLARQRRLTAESHLPLELVGLYWHFVDAIWVFLWPMFYLLRRGVG